MASAELVPLRPDPSFKDVVEALNRLIQILKGNQAGHFFLHGDDGVERNIRGGATISTANYALKILSDAGLHILVRDSTDSTDVLTITDALGINTDLDLYFSGAGRRIRIDGSAATLADRTMFQSIGAAVNTAVSAIPLGVNTQSGFEAYNNAAPGSASVRAIIRADTSAMELRADSPSGSYQPMNFYTNNTLNASLSTGGVLNATTALSAGATVASAGAIRLANNAMVNARNSGNSADINLIGTVATDVITTGQTGTRHNLLGTVVGPAIDPPTVDGQVTAESQCKGYAYFTGTAPPSTGYLYNVSSVTRSSAGIYVVNWDRDFALAVYAVGVAIESAGTTLVHRITAQAVGSVTIRFETTAGTATDPDSARVIAFGTLS